MTNELKKILNVKATSRLPSERLAAEVLEGLLSQYHSDLREPFPVMDEYDDAGYTPSLLEIKAWLDKERDPAIAEISERSRSNTSMLFGSDGQLKEEIAEAIGDFAEGRTDKSTAIKEVADHFRFLDENPLYGGNPTDKHWHLLRMGSATAALLKQKIDIIDALYEFSEALQGQIVPHIAEVLRQESKFDKSSYANALSQLTRSKCDEVTKLMNEVADLGIKIGFLRRDLWWIQSHGDAVVDGYVARQTAEKAGKGGGKSSSEDRLRRITLFLAERVKLVGNNPILKDDPPKDVSWRALKIAMANSPEEFKTGRSKKTATEYWEYIQADQGLRGEYEKLMKSYM